MDDFPYFNANFKQIQPSQQLLRAKILTISHEELLKEPN